MKRIIAAIFFCFQLAWPLTLLSEDDMSSVTITTAESKFTYYLSSNPSLVFSGDMLSVKQADKVVLELNINNVECISHYRDLEAEAGMKEIQKGKTLIEYSPDCIVIKSGGDKSTSIKIFSLDGKLVSSHEVNPNMQIEIKRSEFPSNVYLISIGNEQIYKIAL